MTWRHRLRHEYGVVADARRPDVVRSAPVPMYSTYHDCWRAFDALESILTQDSSARQAVGPTRHLSG